MTNPLVVVNRLVLRLAAEWNESVTTKPYEPFIKGRQIMASTNNAQDSAILCDGIARWWREVFIQQEEATHDLNSLVESAPRELTNLEVPSCVEQTHTTPYSTVRAVPVDSIPTCVCVCFPPQYTEQQGNKGTLVTPVWASFPRSTHNNNKNRMPIHA